MDWAEFERIAYAYRTWPAHDAQGVLDRFNELREFVSDAMHEDSQDAAQYAVDRYAQDHDEW